MFTAAADGSDLHVVDDYGAMSHFIWRDSETILAAATRRRYPPPPGNAAARTPRQR